MSWKWREKKICGVLSVCLSCFVVYKPAWTFWRLDMVTPESDSTSPCSARLNLTFKFVQTVLWKRSLQSLLSGAVNDYVSCKVLESPPEISIPFYLAQSDMCQGLLYIPRGASNITRWIRVPWNLIKCPRNGPKKELIKNCKYLHQTNALENRWITCFWHRELIRKSSHKESERSGPMSFGLRCHYVVIWDEV